MYCIFASRKCIYFYAHIHTCNVITKCTGWLGSYIVAQTTRWLACKAAETMLLLRCFLIHRYYKFTKRCDPVQLALIFSPTFNLVQIKSDLLKVLNTQIGVSIQYVKRSKWWIHNKITWKALWKLFDSIFYLKQYIRLLQGSVACAIKLFKVITCSVKWSQIDTLW